MRLFLLGSPLVAFALSLFLAIFVLLRNHRSTRHRLLSLFLGSMAAEGVLLYLMRGSPDTAHALAWDKAVMPVFVLQGATFLHFSLAHTRVVRGAWLVPLAYSLVVLVAAISFAGTDLLVEYMDEDLYGYLPVTGPLFWLVPVLGYVMCLAGLANYVKAYRLSVSYEVRNSYLYVIAGVCTFLVGAVFDLFSVFGARIPPVAIVGNIVFCVLVSIAILKYHLLDIHVVLRRGIAYLLMSALVAIPYVGIIMISYHLLEIGDISPWVHVVILLVLALALLPMWGRLQRLVDRWFYRERYDHLKALAEFSQQAHDIRDLDRLGSSLAKLIGQALQTVSVYLLLPTPSGVYEVVSSAAADPATLRIEAGSSLLQWLKANDGVLRRVDLDVVPQLQAVSGKDREHLRELGAQLFVPLKTKENELAGLLILGGKRSGQPYSQEDVRLIYTVASRMAVELENARLYDFEIRARRELQQQNEQKTEFLHSVAHELKTPLTAMISSAELLETESPDATRSQTQQIARNIAKGGWRMDKRINELLDFARMTTGTLELQKRPVDVPLLLRDVASQLSILFDNRGQTLSLEVSDSLSEIDADKAKVEQVVVNLLENANKFSPQGGSITLRAGQENNALVVEVEDSAPPITDEEKARVFDPYYRGEDAGRRQRLPGIGLGLAISKRLVEVHSGQIWVDNGRGGGNTFVFTLPIAPEYPEAAGSGGSSLIGSGGGNEGTGNRRQFRSG